MFMEQLDGTVLATALPSMARELGVSAPSLSIALTSYLISLAVFIPVSGRIADRFGARTVFRTAIIIFLLGSISCANAPNVTFLVIARFFEGMGGALMMPVGRLVLMRNVEKRDLIQATSWVLIPAVVGPILGPPVGGFIVTYLNSGAGSSTSTCPSAWSASCWSACSSPTPGRCAGKDRLSRASSYSSLSLGLFLFGFELISHEGEARLALSFLAMGALLGALYIHHARTAKDPILDISLMKIPTFGTSVIAGAITRLTQGAHPYLLPLMMQLGFGLSAAQSGLMTLATALGSISAKPVAPSLLAPLRLSRYADGQWHLRQRRLCGVRPVSSRLAAAADVRWSWCCSGFFMSIQFTGFNTIAYDEVEPAAHGRRHQLLHHLPAADAVHGHLRRRGRVAGCDGACGAITRRSFPISPPPSGRWRRSRLAATIWNRRFSHEAGMRSAVTRRAPGPPAR